MQSVVKSKISDAELSVRRIATSVHFDFSYYPLVAGTNYPFLCPMVWTLGRDMSPNYVRGCPFLSVFVSVEWRPSAPFHKSICGLLFVAKVSAGVKFLSMLVGEWFSVGTNGSIRNGCSHVALRYPCRPPLWRLSAIGVPFGQVLSAFSSMVILPLAMAVSGKFRSGLLVGLT